MFPHADLLKELENYGIVGNKKVVCKDSVSEELIDHSSPSSATAAEFVSVLFNRIGEAELCLERAAELLESVRGSFNEFKGTLQESLREQPSEE